MTGEMDRLERQVGRVLRVGVALSTAILAVGLAFYLVAPASSAANRILDAGLIVLMATPVGRVAVSVVQYTVSRDWLFAALTACVLIVLVGSLLFGLGG